MRLTILQTSDLHGHFFTTNFVSKQAVGLFGIADKINEFRTKSDYSLLIDTGDYYQGSPLASKQEKLGSLEFTNVFNYMKYDVFTPGNHEFNFGYDYLKSALKTLDAKILCANIFPKQYEPYHIYEFEGKKIAIVGLITPFVSVWENQKNIQGLKFTSAVETYRSLEKELQEKADFIIVNYHGGIELEEAHTIENEARKLTYFDSIDLLLTGHQHQEICEKINKVFVVQPGYQGKVFSKTEIDLISLSFNCELIINSGVDSTDANLTNIIKPIQDIVDLELDEVVSTCDEDLIITNHTDVRMHSHPLINVIHQMQMEELGTDLSVTSLFDTAIGFEKSITKRQIFMNYPYPNQLVKAIITGKQLKLALEKSATYFEIENNEIVVSKKFNHPKVQNYNYDMFYGIDYEIDVAKEIGKRVSSLKYQNRDVLDSDKFSIAVNSYRYSDQTLYTMYSETEFVYETTKDMTELFTDFFDNNSHIVANHHSNFKIYCGKED